MEAIKNFIAVLKGESGSIWLRIGYILCIVAVVAVLIMILAIVLKFKARKKKLAATDTETDGANKGKKRTYEWKDRRRLAIGLPWTFDRFRLTKEKLLIVTGFFNIKEEEIKLYRVVDLELTKSFGQRIFGMGTVVVKSSDKSLPQAILKNIKHPNDVKELISELVEKERMAKRVSSNEMMGMHGGTMDIDGDGIPDMPEIDMNAHL